MGYYDNMYGWFREQLRKNYRYRYENAPENVRQCYQPLFYGIIDYASTISMPVKDLAVIEKAYRYCIEDNPYFFFVETATFWIRGFKAGIDIKYNMSREEAGKILSMIQPKVEEVARKCAGKSAGEKELLIHDYLVRNVVYDLNAPVPIHEGHSALVYGRAVCDGISKAAKILFDKVGIPAIVISGDSRSRYNKAVSQTNSGHAWNMVQIDGTFYHLDVTFDNTLTDGDSVIHYDYFNLTEEQIARDHSYEHLKVSATRLNDYFLVNGLYFTGKSALSQAIEAAVKRRAPFFAFRMPYTKDPSFTYNDILKVVKDSIKVNMSYSIGFNPDQMTMYLTFKYAFFF